VTFAPGSLPWLAQHELKLNWRDVFAAMTGGKRRRAVGWLVGGLSVYGVMFLMAWFAIAPAAADGLVFDKPALVTITGMILLFSTVTLSQALESVTRVYYARSDLDLILSSPISARNVFAIRAGAVFLTTMLLSGLLISPLVGALVVQDGPHWLSAYLVLSAVSALAVTIAIATTRLLFHIMGPRRTRLVAQIVAGIMGAGFVIGIQAAAILSDGGLSRIALFQSPAVIAAAPGETSAFWVPARAATGDVAAGLLLAASALAILVATIAVVAPSYARLATSATGLNHVRSQRRAPSGTFAPVSQRQALRRKEWKLLQRDPWLVSQTLTQLLYLLPPALLLWVNYGEGNGASIVVVPVIVMGAGQLAGGLAWLAISGEDAHDLVATAPLSPATILRAKVESVMSVIGMVMAPLLVLLAIIAWPMAIITAACAGMASISATAIQLWFRVRAKRSTFRRRQTASRAATICEAFSSILWAGTGAVWAAGTPLAIVPAIAALAVLALARLIAPRPA
jgi:ABC-2 type transport system permease protein